MTRPLVFATRNRGKLVELRQLLPERDGFEVLDLDQAAARIARAHPHGDEDPQTFGGHTAKNAREVSQA
ncbi:MAG: non-canonical purine NTP pyrophosphatase, partial [Kofleriaceae bacterium]